MTALALFVLAASAEERAFSREALEYLSQQGVRLRTRAAETPRARAGEGALPGCTVYRRHYMRDVFPSSAPQTGEAGLAVELTAAPCEREAATFTVLPLRELSIEAVKCTDLVSAERRVIPSSCVETHLVRYGVRKRSGEVVPGWLDEPKGVLAEGVSWRFWVTVKTPDADAGIYAGRLRLLFEDAPPAELSLRVKVEGRPLIPPPVAYAHYYGDPGEYGSYSDEEERLLRDELAMMVEHGMNAVTVLGLLHGQARHEEGRLVVDWSRADAFMRAYRGTAGMTGPVLLGDLLVQGRGDLSDSYGERWLPKEERHPLGSEEFFKSVEEFVTAVRDHATDSGWPEVVMYASSELSRWRDKKGELIPFGIRLIRTVQSVGRVRVVSSINGPDDPRYVPYPGEGELSFLKHLDIVMYNLGVPINDRTIALAHRSGCELWFQNTGMNRYSDGLMLWKAGAVGRRQYRLDGTLSGGVLIEGKGAFYRIGGRAYPTPAWERMAEGVDDYAYVHTALELAELLADHPAAREARAFVARIKDGLDIEISRHLYREKGKRLGLAPEEYDRIRRELRSHIRSLRKALGE